MQIIINEKLTCTLKGLNTLVFKQGDWSGSALSVAALQLRGEGSVLHQVSYAAGSRPFPFLTFSLILLNCASVVLSLARFVGQSTTKYSLKTAEAPQGTSLHSL